MTQGELARRLAVRSVTNARFTQAWVVFGDGSHIRFQHSSREDRWARASSEGTAADRVCLALSQFRLNGKHLQLFFEDGTNAEFRPEEEPADGTTLG